MSVIWEPRLDETAERFRRTAEDLAREHFGPNAGEIDREGRYPQEHVDLLVEHGLSAMFAPAEYGGAGASLAATCAVSEAVAKGCASTAAILSTYVLGAFPILLAGSEEQRQRYLGGLARGESVSFALTERGAGSDAAAIETTATREGAGFRLRGEKWFIGNGGASRHYVVFAKTAPEAGARGVSAFMVDKDAEGAVIDHYEDKMGIRGTRTSNLKLDTWVPDDAMVGEEGRALSLALKTLNVGRIAVGAQATGIALAAYEEAAARAADRVTFGRPIIDNQGIGFPLADVATELSAARMMLYEAAHAYDRGEDVRTLGAMAKLYTSEVSHRAVDVAVQVFGGYGYCKPYPVERLYRDQRIIEVYEGTSEIQRMVIARAVKAEVRA
jgi:alkylation response protein AidB-like acyl-CoA dehydrogenase